MTETDLERGSVTNSASVTALERIGSNPVTARRGEDSVTVTIPGASAPALTLAKNATALNGTVVGGGVTVAAVGDIVTYAYVVTNSGNVDLSNITVSDDRIASTTIDCDPNVSGVQSTIGALAPEASATCTATYTIVQSDAVAGRVVNVASASDGTTRSPTATETVSVAGYCRKP